MPLTGLMHAYYVYVNSFLTMEKHRVGCFSVRVVKGINRS